MQTEEQLNEAIDSGDPDAIDALLDEMELDEETFSVVEAESDDTSAGDDLVEGADADTSTGNDDASEGDSSAQQDAEEGSERPRIEGKHGNKTIPYGVLESERTRAAEAERRALDAERQLEELQTQAADSAKLQRSNEALHKQLEEHGIDPETPIEDMELTPEMRETFMADFGDLGKLLVRQWDMLHPENTDVPASTDTASGTDKDAVVAEVNAAIDRNEELSSWAQEGGKLWQEALLLDVQLQKDPAFKNSTFDERFAEVVRRTKLTHGMTDDSGKDPQRKSVDDVLADAEKSATPPTSLSDLGAAATAQEKSLVDRLDSMDADRLNDTVMDMSQDQLDALFDQM